jgi:hypothetical protein
MKYSTSILPDANWQKFKNKPKWYSKGKNEHPRGNKN